jgi:hypothetical protein
MRARLTAVLATAALVVTATGAFGATAEPRRATMPYAPTDLNFSVGAPEEESVAWTGGVEALYEFELKKGEKSVDVFIQDDSEMPVGGVVSQWKMNGSQQAGQASATTGEAVTWHRFCGATEAPVAVKPKLPVRITVYEGTCMNGTPSAPTSGQIVVDFHRS